MSIQDICDIEFAWKYLRDNAKAEAVRRYAQSKLDKVKGTEAAVTAGA